VASIPRRGEVYNTRFGNAIGSEQAGTRPALVISPRRINRPSPVVIVVPLTTRMKSQSYAQDVLVPRGIVGVDPGRILCGQIRAVSQHRLGQLRGTLPDWLMLEVDDALRLALDL